MVKGALRARDDFDVPVVALDIAGTEAGYPAKTHEEAFDIAHKVNYDKIFFYVPTRMCPPVTYRYLYILISASLSSTKLYMPEKIGDRTVSFRR